MVSHVDVQGGWEGDHPLSGIDAATPDIRLTARVGQEWPVARSERMSVSGQDQPLRPETNLSFDPPFPTRALPAAEYVRLLLILIGRRGCIGRTGGQAFLAEVSQSCAR